MPGAARRLAPASVLSAVQFVRVRPAARVPVIKQKIGTEDQKRLGDYSKSSRRRNDEKRTRSRSAGVLSCRIRVTVRRAATVGAISCTRRATTGGRFTVRVSGHV
jgi:hypothetical protein